MASGGCFSYCRSGLCHQLAGSPRGAESLGLPVEPLVDGLASPLPATAAGCRAVVPLPGPGWPPTCPHGGSCPGTGGCPQHQLPGLGSNWPWLNKQDQLTKPYQPLGTAPCRGIRTSTKPAAWRAATWTAHDFQIKYF